MRVLYAFNPKRNAILLVGGDKTGDNRWYEAYVPIADRLYDEHLEELKGRLSEMARKFSELREKMSPAACAESEREFRRIVEEMRLEELRTARELTQTALADPQRRAIRNLKDRESGRHVREHSGWLSQGDRRGAGNLRCVPGWESQDQAIRGSVCQGPTRQVTSHHKNPRERIHSNCDPAILRTTGNFQSLHDFINAPRGYRSRTGRQSCIIIFLWRRLKHAIGSDRFTGV